MKLYVMFALVGNWSDSHLYENNDSSLLSNMYGFVPERH